MLCYTFSLPPLWSLGVGNLPCEVPDRREWGAQSKDWELALIPPAPLPPQLITHSTFRVVLHLLTCTAFQVPQVSRMDIMLTGSGRYTSSQILRTTWTTRTFPTTQTTTVPEAQRSGIQTTSTIRGNHLTLTTSSNTTRSPSSGFPSASKAARRSSVGLVGSYQPRASR